jgi:hypothetical protein
MQRTVLTALELDVLHMKVGDVDRQIMVLTGAYHGVAFTREELERLKHITALVVEASVSIRALRDTWRERVASGQEPNRSDTGGADAAGPARPSDDVPSGTAR